MSDSSNVVEVLRFATSPADYPTVIGECQLAYRYTEDQVREDVNLSLNATWEFTLAPEALALVRAGDTLRSDHNFGSFREEDGRLVFVWPHGQRVDPCTGETVGYDYRGPARRVGWIGEEGIGGRV